MTNTFACLVMLTIVVQQTRCADDLLNTVSAVGANVTMRCKTRSGNCSGVTWGIGLTVVSIYKGEVGFLGNYGGRYSIDATSGCHLIVKNVQLTDAGRLSCIDESPTTIAKTAELIVLESEPKCHVSASAETTAEEDRVNLSCEVTFGGTNNVSMTWKDMKNVPSSTKAGRTLGLSHNVTAKRPNVPSYECVASFEIVRNGTNLVPNIPTANCKTQPIKILYGVKSAELSPSQSVYCPGSVVNCSSDGNPPPTFIWQEGETDNGPWKDVADVTGPQFTTSNETSLYYRCVATNVVKNVNYMAASSIFRINYSEQSNYPAAETTTETVTGSTNFQRPLVSITDGGSAGVALFILVAIAISCCVVLLVIIIVVCCCTRKCPCYRCCSSRENSKAKNSYDDGEPLKANPANNSEHLVKNSKPRPPPSGDPPKRPKEAPPQPKPRTDLQKVPQPQQNNYQQEEVTYAALESEMAPHRNRALPAVVAESEYADISKA